MKFYQKKLISHIRVPLNYSIFSQKVTINDKQFNSAQMALNKRIIKEPTAGSGAMAPIKKASASVNEVMLIDTAA